MPVRNTIMRYTLPEMPFRGGYKHDKRDSKIYSKKVDFSLNEFWTFGIFFNVQLNNDGHFVTSQSWESEIQIPYFRS